MNQAFGLINLSLIPLRAKADHASEMTSQLLFGDCFEILDYNNNWIYIKTCFDNYEGWIHDKQFISIDSDTATHFKNAHYTLGPSITHQLLNTDTNESSFLVAGSSIPELDKNNQFKINDSTYQLCSAPTKSDRTLFKKDLLHTAKFYLNAPYLWGGRSPFGIDCSGFTQMVYKQFGIELNRDAYLQAEQGNLVNFLEEATTGDLAFFDNEEGRITHVGIMIGNNQIIHASGKVRIDSIDNQGVFNDELKRYTHNLRIVKTYGANKND